MNSPPELAKLRRIVIPDFYATRLSPLVSPYLPLSSVEQEWAEDNVAAINYYRRNLPERDRPMKWQNDEWGVENRFVKESMATLEELRNPIY
jgi:hypothetical protein